MTGNVIAMLHCNEAESPKSRLLVSTERYGALCLQPLAPGASYFCRNIGEASYHTINGTQIFVLRLNLGGSLRSRDYPNKVIAAKS